uniref:collagen-like repeat preface domain-containing protein n=1 Tax=Bacillus thuringiensis TaxID=1428 RepID=UPI0011231716
MSNFDKCNKFNNCPPNFVFSNSFENNQTVPITSQQLSELIRLLNSLLSAIPAFFLDPNDINRLLLINLFNQFLDLLNSLAPSTEGNYLKQLIQSILNQLQSPNPDLGQLTTLLQQFYSAFPSFLSSLIIPAVTLQTLLGLLTQLISNTPGDTGPTGATGP